MPARICRKAAAVCLRFAETVSTASTIRSLFLPDFFGFDAYDSLTVEILSLLCLTSSITAIVLKEYVKEISLGSNRVPAAVQQLIEYEHDDDWREEITT